MSAQTPSPELTDTTEGSQSVPEQDCLLAEFTSRYNSAYPRLVGQVEAITGDARRAQRMVQRAFVRAWRRWRTVRLLDDPIAWVRREALRRPASGPWAGRRPRARQDAVPDTPGMDPQNVVVLEALLRLPESQRRALVLHHMAGLPVSQVAEDERITRDSMSDRLRRARTALIALLEDDRHETEKDRT